MNDPQNNQQAELTPLVYVCVISNFNLPEFESCLLRRPSHLVLVVSTHMQKNADLFEQQISKTLPGIQVIRPDKATAFGGSDCQECNSWAQHTLLTHLNALPGTMPRVCNITGGTKAITLSLINPVFRWRWLDYKADQKQQLQRLHINTAGAMTVDGSDGLPMATPDQVAGLHSWNVQKRPNNPIMDVPDSSLQANKLWQALSEPESEAGQSLLSLFGGKESGLEKLWVYERGKARKKDTCVTQNANEFAQQDQFNAQQLDWLQGWHRLAPESLQFTASCITLAAGSHTSDPLRRWLSGDWLEQWVADRLREWLPAEHIACNLKVNPLKGETSSSGERETDIMVHYNGVTTIIEVKTDMPPAGGVKALLEQIASMGDRLGRTRKILFVGPQLKQKMVENFDDIKKRCDSNNVKLCSSATELKRLIMG
jgi:hypothetical protein